MQLQKSGPSVEKLNNEFNAKNKGFSIELINELNSKHDTVISDKIEALMSNCFDSGNSGIWREGHLKASFNYLLIDPRVSENLPARAKYLGKFKILSPFPVLNIYYSLDSKEVFRIFIASIFYVGKGTRSRPYAHLYDALKIWKAEIDQIDSKRKVKEDVR